MAEEHEDLSCGALYPLFVVRSNLRLRSVQAGDRSLYLRNRIHSPALARPCLRAGNILAAGRKTAAVSPDAVRVARVGAAIGTDSLLGAQIASELDVEGSTSSQLQVRGLYVAKRE